MKSRLVLMILVLLFLQCRSQRQDSADPFALENTYWRLIEVNGNPVTTPPEGREIYMRLTHVDNQHRLTGHAGCNGLGGDYKIGDGTIKFQPITTRMYCDTQMDVENAFTKMLTIADNYRIDGRQLKLYAADALLGKFEAGDPDSSGPEN